MSYGRRRRYPREPDPHEAQWERDKAKYLQTRERLSRGAVQISAEDAMRRLGLNSNTARGRVRIASLSDARKMGEPVGHLFRFPGIGLFENGGLGGIWYIRAAVLKRLEAKHSGANSPADGLPVDSRGRPL